MGGVVIAKGLFLHIHQSSGNSLVIIVQPINFCSVTEIACGAIVAIVISVNYNEDKDTCSCHNFTKILPTAA